MELEAVKFWRVEEPVRRRFERVVRPAVAVRVPVKLAAEEMVWLLIKPEVIGPAVRVPMLPEVEKRLVEKKLVVVALVPVALVKVKFWRVEEEVVSRLTAVSWLTPVILFESSIKMPEV